MILDELVANPACSVARFCAATEDAKQRLKALGIGAEGTAT
jgi:hypothetical protein